ncbi:MAG: hypothetical protein KC457_25725 [Myxococcales bacterium]|nr:hypothetical protein [Myxococcales bacterium]
MTKQIINSLFAFALFAVGCDQGMSEPSDLDLESLEDRMPEGVVHTKVDGVDNWEIHGVEAHEWYRDYLIVRAVSESPERAALTWEDIELIDESLETMADEISTRGEEEFRAQSVSAAVCQVYGSGSRGLKAQASANKTSLPANIRVETKVLIDGYSVEDNKSKWGTGTLSGYAQKTVPSPSSCYGRAYAYSAGSTVTQVSSVCPPP